MDWINVPLLSALGQALLHSLWQFTLLIGLAHFFAQQLKRADWRHNVYFGSLLLLPLLFLATFYFALPADLATSVATITTQGERLILTNEVARGDEAAPLNWLTDHFLETMALLYLAGLLLLALRSGVDWWQIRQLRQKSIKPSAELLATYERLKSHFPGFGTYEVRLSGHVSSALTVGVFRPFIVLPLSFINALAPAEVEAILLHEMAHLFRRDHLWNTIQTLLTQLFFYHPMVRWLRLRLDREREYACDDLVTGWIDRGLYAQSLLKVARLSITHKNQFVMQAQGKSHFTQRVQRLVASPTDPARRRWWLLPVFVLPFMLAMLLPAQGVEEAIAENPAAKIERSFRPLGDPATTIYVLNGVRYPSFELLSEQIVDNYSATACGASDPELKAINEAEGTNYEMIAYYTTVGDAADSPVKSASKSSLSAQDSVPTFGDPAKTVYFLNGERYAAYADFADQLETDTYTQIFGSKDAELQAINATEGSNYEMIVRFYTGEVRQAILKSEANAMTADLRGTAKPLEKTATESLSSDGDAVKENGKKATALSIDGIPVTIEADADDAPSIKGQYLTYYDATEEATQVRSQQDGKDYDGLVEVVTTQPQDSTIPDPVDAISMRGGITSNDSILVTVNGQDIAQRNIGKLDPKHIESINVYKGSNIPGEYQGRYNGIIAITLKPGIAVDDLKIPARDEPSEPSFTFDPDDPKSLRGKEVLILIDDKEATVAEYEALDPETIATVNVVKGKAKVKKEGYKKYKALIKIKTKSKLD